MKMMAMKVAAGFVWCLGLLLAGSENANMPWPNILGVCLFMLASAVITGNSLESEKTGWKSDGAGKSRLEMGSPKIEVF